MTEGMEKHVRIVSTIMIIFGIIYLLAVACLGMLGLATLKNLAQTEDIAILPTVLTAVALSIPLIFIGGLHIVTGRAFRAGANWSRVGLWILAIINLGNVPIGTAIGVYTIWVLVKTREEVKTIR